MDKTLVTKALEHNRTWPFVEQQVLQIELLAARIRQWKTQYKTLLQTIRAMHLVYSENYKNLQTALSRFKKKNAETTDINMLPLQYYLEGLVAQEQTVLNLIESVFMPKIDSFQIRNRAKAFMADLRSELSSITDHRAKMIKSLHEHQKMKLTFHDKVHHEQVDPWLQERVLLNDMHAFVDKENQFQKNVLKIKQNMLRFEGEWSTELARFYTDLFNAKISHAPVSHRLDGSAATTAADVPFFKVLEDLTESASYDLYWKPKGLDDDSIWTKQQSIPTCSLIDSPIAIIKEGLLMRPGKFRTGTWKTSFFVLTETGYLHCFNPSSKGQLESGSISSANIRVSRSMSEMSKSASYASQLGENPVYDQLTKPETFYSVSLNQPKVRLALIQDSIDLHVMELVVPKKKSLLSLARDKNALTTYPIKCQCESEMIEWAAAIKKKIESYLPDGPPQPLFKTMERIEMEVDNLIHQSDPAQESEPAPSTTTTMIKGQSTNNDSNVTAQQNALQPTREQQTAEGRSDNNISSSGPPPPHEHEEILKPLQQPLPVQQHTIAQHTAEQSQVSPVA